MGTRYSAAIGQLLQRVSRGDREADLEALAEAYAAEAATEEDRAAIREAAATRQMCFRLEAWGLGISEADPLRYLRLRLSILSMSDGRPDSRDAFLLAKELTRLATQQGEDCERLLERLVAVSTPRVRHLFSSPTLDMTLWRD